MRITTNINGGIMRRLYTHKLSRDRLIQIENLFIEAQEAHNSMASGKETVTVDGEKIDFGYKRSGNGFSWASLTGTFIEFIDDTYLYVSGNPEYIDKHLKHRLTPEEISELVIIKEDIQDEDIPGYSVRQSA
jgi:hypothetical protein